MSTVDPDDAWANHPVDGGPLTMGTGPDMSTFFDAIDAAEAAEAERRQQIVAARRDQLQSVAALAGHVGDMVQQNVQGLPDVAPLFAVVDLVAAGGHLRMARRLIDRAAQRITAQEVTR